MGGEALMTTRATVLYDAPGPKGRRLNSILTAITVVVVAVILVLVAMKLNDKG